ncbi:MAG: hypothetical protein HDQ99_22245 [Lachnospiraceae bacterium]|nr:hypothetical protein [Lachnospiraceae bacterium]MBD5538310.1 hypothetical protein [Lachnospiraceae bacterium]
MPCRKRRDNDFSRLPDLFVITILNYDPFGCGYMMYTAENAMDTSTKELHDYVSRVKTIPEVRQGYMSLSERFFYERQEGIKEGARENTVENILELLEDYGEIPEELKEMLNSIEDMAVLKKYLKLAAKVGGIAEFQAAISEQKK